MPFTEGKAERRGGDKHTRGGSECVCVCVGADVILCSGNPGILLIPTLVIYEKRVERYND